MDATVIALTNSQKLWLTAQIRHESLHRDQSTFQQAALIDSVDCYFVFFSPRAEDGSQGLALARRELYHSSKTKKGHEGRRVVMVWNGELEVDVTKVHDIKETKDLWEFFFWKQGLT